MAIRTPTCNRLLMIRITASISLGLTYLVFSWMPARFALRDVLATVLACFAYNIVPTEYDGAPAFRIAHVQIYFTPDCTYIDLFLLSAPFIWALNARWRRNVFVICLFACGIATVNLLRLVLTSSLYAEGYSWFLSHDVFDYLIYYPFLGAAVLKCYRQDRRTLDERNLARNLAQEPARHSDQNTLPASGAAWKEGTGPQC